jgi:hypothetical protein
VAQVVKATVGSGWLGGNQETWWSWKVTWGDVWAFWVDVTGGGSSSNTVEIARVQTRRDGETNWALINIKNATPDGAVFFVRVARIF